jgi:hypothetical protein
VVLNTWELEEHLKNICLRHMSGDKGWFSSLVPVVTKRYISFGDNGQGHVLLEGE